MTYSYPPEPVRLPGPDHTDWRQVTRSGDSWPRRRAKARRRDRGTRRKR